MSVQLWVPDTREGALSPAALLARVRLGRGVDAPPVRLAVAVEESGESEREAVEVGLRDGLLHREAQEEGGGLWLTRKGLMALWRLAARETANGPPPIAAAPAPRPSWANNELRLGASW